METFGDTMKNLEISIPDSGKVYAIGGAMCLVVYGYRYGVRALREYWIENHKNPNRINAGTSLDAVLYGSLKGVAKGLVPSLVWPVLLSSYGIIKINETRIKSELEEEFKRTQKQ